jgi:thiamine-phosphate diphosphorylase
MTRQIPRLHLLSDRSICPLERFPEVARQAVEAGFDGVHLREKDLPGQELLEAARHLRHAIGDGARILINERLDIALISGADGVQMGEQGLSPLDIRAVCGDSILIGRSVHDENGAERAAVERADFIIAGHVYPTPSKSGRQARGPRFITRVAEASGLPVIAIGGITPERVPEVIQAGAHGVVVLSGILATSNPAAAARAYRRAIDEIGVHIDASEIERETGGA